MRSHIIHRYIGVATQFASDDKHVSAAIAMTHFPLTLDSNQNRRKKRENAHTQFRSIQIRYYVSIVRHKYFLAQHDYAQHCQLMYFHTSKIREENPNSENKYTRTQCSTDVKAMHENAMKQIQLRRLTFPISLKF